MFHESGEIRKEKEKEKKQKNSKTSCNENLVPDLFIFQISFYLTIQYTSRGGWCDKSIHIEHGEKKSSLM